MSLAVEMPLPDPERRFGRLAALCAGLSVAVLMAALIVANSASSVAARGDDDGERVDRLRQLTNLHEESTTQALAAGLRCLGLLLGIGVGVYLYWLVRRRGGTPHRAVLWAAVAGPVLVAAATVFGFIALRDISDTFFASGAQTAARASDLIEDDSTLRIASVFDVGSRIVFAAWIALLSLQMMRLELLTTFLGYWGVGAAGALVLLPIGDAMYIGWLASVGFIAYGWWPGGMPEGWAARPPKPAP